MVDTAGSPSLARLSQSRGQLAYIMMTIENWSGFAIAGLGALSIGAIASAAQVWAYPAPRAVLSILAWKSGNLAFLWACVAIGIRSARQMVGCYTAPGLSAASLLFYVITVLTVFFMLWWWGYPLLIAFERLVNCGAGSHGICNIDLEAAQKIPDFAQKLEAFLSAIPK